MNTDVRVGLLRHEFITNLQAINIHKKFLKSLSQLEFNRKSEFIMKVPLNIQTSFPSKIFSRLSRVFNNNFLERQRKISRVFSNEQPYGKSHYKIWDELFVSFIRHLTISWIQDNISDVWNFYTRTFSNFMNNLKFTINIIIKVYLKLLRKSHEFIIKWKWWNLTMNYLIS